MAAAGKYTCSICRETMSPEEDTMEFLEEGPAAYVPLEVYRIPLQMFNDLEPSPLKRIPVDIPKNPKHAKATKLAAPVSENSVGNRIVCAPWYRFLL